jgi:mono/diheme cytochrome c family protein
MLLAVGCGDSASQDETSGLRDSGNADQATGVSLSAMAREGEELFDANCSVCHGERAAGTNQGPTLIDRIYHPGHHSDASIRNAVSRGVQQHHWVFGDMAPVAGVSSDDVEKIICYVRELQRADGIFEGDDFQTVC